MIRSIVEAILVVILIGWMVILGAWIFLLLLVLFVFVVHEQVWLVVVLLAPNPGGSQIVVVDIVVADVNEGGNLSLSDGVASSAAATATVMAMA